MIPFLRYVCDVFQINPVGFVNNMPDITTLASYHPARYVPQAGPALLLK